MANNKFYGYTPKKDEVTSEWEEGSGGYGNHLDKVNPYEFKKGMDVELTEMGCMSLRESTPEEREKATETVLKNLKEHSGYYTSLITYETLFRNVKGSKPTFKAWLRNQENIKMQEVNRGDEDSKHKDDKMTDKLPKYTKSDYTVPFKTSPLKETKMNDLKNVIKKKLRTILKEQAAKQAAMADMEDEEETPKKGKENNKKKSKEKPVRKDRFDKEEEAIKDILFRLDAKGKKPKEEGDYTKDEPAPGSMLDAKNEMLAKYKELKADETDPKKTLEEYNKLLAEKNEEYKDTIEKFAEEFESNGISIADIYGDKLSDTIKKLQERLNMGLNKARAGVEEEARGIRREVAQSHMTREEALRLLEICSEQGISLREGTENIKVYYEIAKAAYLEGVANALNL